MLATDENTVDIDIICIGLVFGLTLWWEGGGERRIGPVNTRSRNTSVNGTRTNYTSPSAIVAKVIAVLVSKHVYL